MTLSVLMFCPQFRPLVGGAERQAEKLAGALVRRGARVTVLTPQLGSDTPLTEEDQGVTIHRFPLSYLGQRFPKARGLGLLNLLQIRAQVVAAVQQHLHEVDLLHAHIASPLTAFAVEVAHSRCVPTICKIAVAGERSDLEEVVSIGLGGRTLARSMVRRLDRWIATTQAVAASLTRWQVPSERIALIPNGVDLPALTEFPRVYAAATRFIYLGRLSTTTWRDVPTLVRAFDRAAARDPSVELALVGDGNLFKETADLVAQCRHGNRILMPGHQPPEHWLRWADCFVLPSRREGLSNALLEAMSFGLACIANDIPSNREVLANGAAGVLVPVGDEDALVGALDRMANDAGHVQIMQTAGLDHVRSHYGIDSVADRCLSLYASLLAGSGR